MAFKYVVYDEAGERLEGVIDAPTEELAETALWHSRYTIAELKPVKPQPRLEELMPSFFGVKRRELIVFSRHLATLLGSGISILSALQFLTEQTTSRGLRTVLAGVVSAIQEGASLSQALEEYPRAFPRLYREMVRVGERTGNMEAVLRQMAAYLERDDGISHKVRGAATYPTLVLIMAFGVAGLLIMVAVPAMSGLFKEFGAQLPLTTRVLIATSQFLSNYKLHLLATVLIVATFSAYYTSQPAGRRRRDLVLLRAPIIGSITMRGNMSRIARTMATLLGAGLPLAEIGELVFSSTGNTVLQGALEEVWKKLLRGEGLSPPLAESKLFPSLLVQMVRLGEETGTLEPNLETLANFYEEEVDRKVEALSAALTPALTMFVGLVVGFLYASLLMPMYSIMGQIK